LTAAQDDVRSATRRIVTTQAIVAAILGVGFWIGMGQLAAVSALYGSVISVVSALLLGRGVTRAEKLAIDDPKRSLGILYFGAVQRFVLVAVMLAIGLSVLQLMAIPTFVGFALAQMAFVYRLKA